MKSISKIIGIKEEELKKTLLLQLVMFLLITTLLILKPTINSLFLTELSSDSLPLGYVLTALVAVIGYFFYRKALDNYALDRIIYVTYLVSILFLVFYVFAFFLEFQHNVIFLYSLFVFVALFGLLSTSQLWLLIGSLYNVRGAKKAFGFIGSGAIAGGIFGGYLTSVLTHYINTEELLIIAALFIFVCILLVRYIWSTEVRNNSTPSKLVKKDIRNKSSFKLVKESKLLLLITTVIGISVLVAKLVDFQYNDYASKLMQDSEDLAGFFGFWLSSISVFSLVIQLLFTKKILNLLGVGRSMALLPSGIIIGSLLFLFIPELWVLIGIKIIDGSLKQSINKASQELVFIPIPFEVKKKTKNFIDVVVDSIATGFAGVLLLVCVNIFHVSSEIVSIAIIIFIVIWLITIYFLKKTYVQTFKKLIAVSNITHTHVHKKEEVDKLALSNRVEWVLKSGDEDQIVLILHKILDIHNEHFFLQIKPLLKHSSSRVRKLAIRNLYFLNTENLSSEIETLIFDEDQKVVIEAFRYLVERFEGNHEELLNKYLDSKDQHIVNAALIGLSLEVGTNKQLQQKFGLENRLKRVIFKWFQTVDIIEKAYTLNTVIEVVGNTNLVEFYYILHEELENTNTPNYKNILLSVSKTKEDQFINGIINFLGSKKTRNTAKIALFEYGETILQKLENKVLTKSIDVDQAKFIPSVIEMFDSTKAAKSLMQLISHAENPVDIEAIESLKRLKWQGSIKKIESRFIYNFIKNEVTNKKNSYAIIKSLEEKIQACISVSGKNDEIIDARRTLIKVLKQRMHWHDDRMAGIVELKYSIDDMELMKKVFTDPNSTEQQRINAIEFLDNTLDVKLRLVVIPFLEMNYNYLLKNNLANDLPSYSDIACFNLLLNRPDTKIKHTMLYLISKLNDKTFIPILKEASKDINLLVRKQAFDLLNKFEN